MEFKSLLCQLNTREIRLNEILFPMFLTAYLLFADILHLRDLNCDSNHAPILK